MLTKPQKILIHQAKRQAGLEDTEYRDILETVGGPGCRSSTDPRLDNRHLDKLMAWMEAIYQKSQISNLKSQIPSGPFRVPNYWRNKNTAAETSRDRYNQSEISNLKSEISNLEAELINLGNHPNYLAAIRSKVTNDRTDPKSLWAYKSALERTLATKKKKLAA